jgi:hypothetical protein
VEPRGLTGILNNIEGKGDRQAHIFIDTNAFHLFMKGDSIKKISLP